MISPARRQSAVEEQLCFLRPFGKLAFTLAVRKHIVQDMLLCLVCLFKWLAVLLLGEDVSIILLLRAVVCNMLHNHGSLLVFN